MKTTIAGTNVVRLTLAAIGLAFALALAPAASVGSPARQDRPDAAPPDSVRENLERFRHLPPEERHRLVENHRRWKKLSAEEKETVHRRHKAFTEQQRRALEHLSRDERERLQSLSPEERRRALRRHLSEWRRRCDERFVHALPADKRKEIDALPQPARARAIDELRKEKVDCDQRRFLDRQVREGRLGESERSKLDTLPIVARSRRIEELRRAEEGERDREFVRKLSRDGRLPDSSVHRIESLPESERRREIGRLRIGEWLESHAKTWERVPREERARLLQSSPSEFFRAVRKYRAERPDEERPSEKDPR